MAQASMLFHVIFLSTFTRCHYYQKTHLQDILPPEGPVPYRPDPRDWPIIPTSLILEFIINHGSWELVF